LAFALKDIFKGVLALLWRQMKVWCFKSDDACHRDQQQVLNLPPDKRLVERQLA
jgi:hypothetical protein